MEIIVEFRVRRKGDGSIFGYEWLDENGWWNSVGGVYSTKGMYDGVYSTVNLVREKYSGFKAVDGEKIYIGDKVSARVPNEREAKLIGKVIYDAGCFTLKVTEKNTDSYDVGSRPPLYDFIDFEILKK